MREIKFRGKRKDNGEWIYGDLLQGCQICDVCEISDCTSVDGTRYEIKKETIGQYTGLKDRNGKEIYEGDIVQDIDIYLTHKQYLKKGLETKEQLEKYKDCGNIAVVEFDTENIGSCGCCYTQFTGTGFKAKGVDLFCCKVIGNIYENKELLEG